MKLENVAINDVLPLKATLIAALRTENFGGIGTPATEFRWFYLHLLCGVTIFRWHRNHGELLPYFSSTDL